MVVSSKECIKILSVEQDVLVRMINYKYFSCQYHPARRWSRPKPSD